MTCDGVDGTAAGIRLEARLLEGGGEGERRPALIKQGDGRPRARYIEPAYLHTPAGFPPDIPRRERQVAIALRNGIGVLAMSVICGCAGAMAPARHRRRCPAMERR